MKEMEKEEKSVIWLVVAGIITVGVTVIFLNWAFSAPARASEEEKWWKNIPVREQATIGVSLSCADYPLREGAKPVVCGVDDGMFLHLVIPTDVKFADVVRIRYRVSAADGTVLLDGIYAVRMDAEGSPRNLILPISITSYDLASRSYTVDVALNTGSYIIGGKFLSSPCKAQ